MATYEVTYTNGAGTLRRDIVADSDDDARLQAQLGMIRDTIFGATWRVLAIDKQAPPVADPAIFNTADMRYLAAKLRERADAAGSTASTFLDAGNTHEHEYYSGRHDAFRGAASYIEGYIEGATD